MNERIIKIESLHLISKEIRLTIKPIENISFRLPELEISQNLKEWKLTGNLDKEEIFLTHNDSINLDNRKGIWYSQEKNIFFSKISLFEESQYIFQFYKLEKINSEITYKLIRSKEDFKNNLKAFFENPKLWVKSIKAQYVEGNWIINFGEFTGRLKIKKSIIKDQFNDIEIISRKFTKQNYLITLKLLNTFIHQIFFKFKSPTEILASRKYKKAEIEIFKQYNFPLFILIRAILNELSEYFSGLKRFLNKNFFYEREIIENYKLNNFANINYTETFIHPNNYCFLDDVVNKNIRSLLYKSKKFIFSKFEISSKDLTYDTIENRFVKYVLNLLMTIIGKKDICNFFEVFDIKKEYLDFQTIISEKIHYFERMDVKKLQKLPLSSQILQKNSYYRRFLHYFIWLQNPTVFNVDNIFTIDSKPMDQIYEYLCLYVIKTALDLIVDDNCEILTFPHNMANHIELQDNSGISSYRSVKYISFKYSLKDNSQLILIYKPERYPFSESEKRRVLYGYSTPNTMLKPDFLLVKISEKNLIEAKVIEKFIVIDAKYRVDSINLISKMHFYKDNLQATGSIFINPNIEKKDFNHSSIITTPSGNLSAEGLIEKDGVYKTMTQDQKKQGFMLGINLLGLGYFEEDIDKELSKFKNSLKTIIQTYFLN